MHVLPVHGDTNGDGREHQDRDADVPVGDPQRDHHDQNDETDAADATGRVRGLADGAVRAPPVG
jgi:hypothetical protein